VGRGEFLKVAVGEHTEGRSEKIVVGVLLGVLVAVFEYVSGNGLSGVIPL